ncbi:MAG: peroxiredoxin-like family protein [Ferruginibacter sp.]
MKKISLLFTLMLSVHAIFAQDTMKPTGLQVGDKAPLFSVKDYTGKEIKLKKELKKGPVILVFYRGEWCPYCNKELSFLNDSLEYIKAKGASVIAISPETNSSILKTIGKTKASFPVISDIGLAIMKNYKVNFKVEDEIVKKYKGFGVDFNMTNGENGANLPVPATYIIGKNGLVKYVYFNPDYRKRSSVKDLLDNL